MTENNLQSQQTQSVKKIIPIAQMTDKQRKVAIRNEFL